MQCNFHKAVVLSKKWANWNNLTQHQRTNYTGTLKERGFILIPIATARAWNSLPSFVTSSSSLSTFKRHLRTYLFATSYWWRCPLLFLSLSTEHVVVFFCVTCPCSFLTKCQVNLFVNNNNNNIQKVRTFLTLLELRQNKLSDFPPEHWIGIRQEQTRRSLSTCRLEEMLPEDLCSWWHSDPDSEQWHPSPISTDDPLLTESVATSQTSYFITNGCTITVVGTF